MKSVVVVLSSAPNEKVGARLARTLVTERLVACVNVVPRVRSIYRWQGKLCDEAEVLLVMKTRRALVAKLKKRLPQLHPYEVPELMVLDVADALTPYLRWVGDTVGSAAPRRR